MDHCLTVTMTSSGATIVTEPEHCVCPIGYVCPKNPRATMYEEKCDFVSESRAWQCFMNCLPG